MGIREDHLHRHGRRTDILHDGRTEPLEGFFFCCSFGDIRRWWHKRTAKRWRGTLVAVKANRRDPTAYMIFGRWGTAGPAPEKNEPSLWSSGTIIACGGGRSVPSFALWKFAQSCASFLTLGLAALGLGWSIPRCQTPYQSRSPWRLPHTRVEV